MKSRDFVYWLQGYFEISGATNITEAQTAVIKNHLNMVFKHEIDPSNGDEKHNRELSDLHKGTPFETRIDGALTGIKIEDFKSILNC